MKRMNFRSLLLVVGVLFLVTGCVSNKRHNREVNALQAQVNTLASEVSRIDSQAQTGGARSAVSAPQIGGESAGVSGFAASAVYRTPSGFELPAADIQQALKSAGYYDGALDGKIGPKAREAIRAFQRDHGLTADGVCGRRTWDQLKSYLGGSASPVIK
ncbi:MAG: peptidoglycan-binding protein [Candidatus Omnitrophica bacterium]|nr:peptidoglycan-binding protein [Candidatus Omnitrophota bacterium]